MSDTIATYSFLPWLRQGIANKITAGDQDTNVKVRATIHVDLVLEGEKTGGGGKITETIPRDIEMYGPGDIVGIDPKAIVKNEPLNWITNFEPNYLPYVDFYEEDFLWRYTPSAPDTSRDRLKPWIALVVLPEGDIEDGQNILGKPLPFITVEDAASKFPPADELWAWAHVHINDSLTAKISAEPGDKDEVITNFQNIIAKNPDLAHSRILCPMKLESNKGYHAFLVPSFETGRLAGLGLDVSAATISPEIFATRSAWSDYSGREETSNFPYYHRWYFKTGDVGDFEYLVRLLEPKPVDKRVGRRDMDVQEPGSNIRGIQDPELGGILKLGGALQIPFDSMSPEDQQDVTKYDEWDQPGYPHQFQEDMAEFINLADSYTTKTAADANNETHLDPTIKDDCDPMITSPLYGRWHALVNRLLKDRSGSDVSPNDNWVHELNLDPRWRVAAGFGTKVVQDNQENYMTSAWKQVGDILEANRKMRLAQLSKITSLSWYTNHIQPLVTLNSEMALSFSAPVQKRVLNNGLTVYHQVDKSVISRSLVAIPTRKILRPGGRVMKQLPFNERVKADNLITRVNEGEVVIARPKVIPGALPTVDQLAEDTLPKNIPKTIIKWLRSASWLKWLLLAIVIVLILIILFAGLSGALAGILAVVAAGLVALFVAVLRWEKQIKAVDSIKEENQTPESVHNLPTSSDFVLTKPLDNFRPSKGGTDSKEAALYKVALKDSLILLDATRTLGKKEPRPKINIADMVNVTIKAIDPELTIPRLLFNSVHIPARIKDKLMETFVEAMAYPEIDAPMYKPLTDISSELFLPNINFIEQNTISLLETNQKFIEAYMVGLNHEFSRELLWREYPTDLRGSYFRQFWDVSSFFETEGIDEEELKEKLRDIPPLHRWSKFSSLGAHDNREEQGENEEELVLVIRGELLKKYPNAVVYAQKAKWQLKENGDIDTSQERELVEITPAEAENPPKSKLLTPLYEAKVSPDIHFFGFDLTATEAQGGTGESPGDIDKAGWFFCIKERPGEPRFGLDIDQDLTPNVWSDLSWQDVVAGGAPGQFIQINNATPAITLKPLDVSDNEKEEQREDDNHVSWNKDMNAADLAYILYQVPVLVAVHAAEMLPK